MLYCGGVRFGKRLLPVMDICVFSLLHDLSMFLQTVDSSFLSWVKVML